jgi:hypothetical protein
MTFVSSGYSGRFAPVQEGSLHQVLHHDEEVRPLGGRGRLRHVGREGLLATQEQLGHQVGGEGILQAGAGGGCLRDRQTDGARQVGILNLFSIYRGV